MTLVAGRIGATSGEEIKIDSKLRKELEAIAKANAPRMNPWDPLTEQIVREYHNTVSATGIVKMLHKVKPDVKWTESKVRDKVRRILGRKK